KAPPDSQSLALSGVFGHQGSFLGQARGLPHEAMAILYVLQGRNQGKRFDLLGPSQTLGRDGCNPIQVADSEISRRHAEIRKDDEGYLLVDLASSNGTFVNADQITERRLVNGDRIQVGNSLLLFTDVDEQQPQPLEHDV